MYRFCPVSGPSMSIAVHWIVISSLLVLESKTVETFVSQALFCTAYSTRVSSETCFMMQSNLILLSARIVNVVSKTELQVDAS